MSDMPLGLQTLRAPEDNAIVKFNLVLVHGLIGNAINTWEHDNTKSWPKDFFPLDKDLNNVKVSTWGYRPVDPSSLYSIGENLCSDLHDHKIHKHPITFIGHGIGGLVIKCALTIAKSRESLFSEILQSTRHVIFLDTPHSGISKDALTLMCGDSVASHTLKNFSLWSNVLGDLIKSFAEVSVNFNISSACSSLFLPLDQKGVQVTPGHSAFIHARHERTFPMDQVTHMTICKFASEEDVNYKRLAARINIGQSGIGTQDARIKDLRQWISGHNDMNQTDQQDNLNQKHHGTCNWIFQDPLFQRWVAREETVSAIWVTGSSGVGKTILCSVVVDYVSNLSERPGVVFLFLKFDLHPSKLDMLRMIASKLLDRVIESDIIPADVFEEIKFSNNECRVLERVIRTLLDAAMYSGPVFFFVDGVNEVATTPTSNKQDSQRMIKKELKDAKDLVELLFKLSNENKDVRLWFSSQADSRTSSWMDDKPVHELKIPEKESNADVQRYLKWAIESKTASTDRIESPLLQILTESSLHIFASNNFRWAAMMIDSISNCVNDDEVMTTIIKSLPYDLSELYKNSLDRLRDNDIEDQRRRPGSIGLSKAILSILTFAKRPLSVEEVQEAIAAYGFSLTLSRPPSMSSSKPWKTALIKRCVPFVKHVVPKEDGTDMLRLSHQSVHTFLLENSNRNPDDLHLSGRKAEPSPMVDTAFLAKACLEYLFQDRYSSLLVKHTASEFLTKTKSKIRDHHLLQYAAKYWYRHLEETEPTKDLSIRLLQYVKSQQFITSIQVQSLFVPGHFIQDLDCDNRSKRCIKKNLPDWLRSHGGTEIMQDYLQFLAEWGPFLQRGISDTVNGEIDRCLWSVLGSSNYFTRYASLQRYYAYLLQPGDETHESALFSYVSAASFEAKRITVWRIDKPLDPAVDEVPMVETTWALDEERAVVLKTRTRQFIFSKAGTNWDLYDPGEFRALRLIPSPCAPERVAPVAFTDGCQRLRIGSSEFNFEGGACAGDDETNIAYGSTYWEDIYVRRPYRVKSRRRTIRASRRRHKVGRYINPDMSSSEEDDKSHASYSEDSCLSYGITSPAESWTSATGTSMQESSTESESEEQANMGSSSTSESGDFEIDRSKEPSEGDSSKSSSSSSTNSTDDANNQDRESLYGSSESVGFCGFPASGDDSDASIPLRPKGKSQVSGLGARVKRGVTSWNCDTCGTKQITKFYQCRLCTMKDSFDICQSCFDDGKWCRDKFHVLSKKRLDSHGSMRNCGDSYLNDCTPGQCLLVERLNPALSGGPSPQPIFRFQDSGANSGALYDSHPRIHPTKPLLVWPIGRWKILYADIEANKYFKRPSHDQFPASQWAHEISTSVHFSSCGQFMYIATIYERGWYSERERHSGISLVLSTNRLSSHRTACPPKELARTVVELGAWRRLRVAGNPFNLTWEENNLYLAISAEKLCVYRIPLKLGKVGPVDNRQTATPANEVIFPRSARNRKIQFFPSDRPTSDGMVIIGPRDGVESSGPIVIYLPEGSLGDWMPVEKAADIDISDNHIRRKEPLFEDFDAEDDCDLIPYDPNFNP